MKKNTIRVDGNSLPEMTIMLNVEERLFVEVQVRGCRAVSAMEDRCRMILRCAGGVTNKAVAAKLDLRQRMVSVSRANYSLIRA